MKIVIVSIYFPPKIGGVENIMFGLVDQWHRMGHTVVVFTSTKGESACNFKVIRSLSLRTLWNAVRECDVFFEANISLKTWWIGALNRRKWFVLHHLTYTHIQRWQEVIKNELTRFSTNISASAYIARTLKGKSEVIPNFYSNDFIREESIRKHKDVVFVGRLVSDKGADDFVKAIIILKNRSVNVTCTIIGDGPEKDKLMVMIARAGLGEFVRLQGAMMGKELVEEMNAHRIIVVPSKWPEPFGIVVLEGLACGCRVVCSSEGGLPEAASGFGLEYPNHDVVALSDRIQQALAAGLYSQVELNAIGCYLKARTATVIAGKYLDFFSSKSKK